MAKIKASAGGVVRVNGADIYHEVRGAGPSLLLIHGAGSDGGTWGRLADDLARDFTVIAYDRRGLSRSPRPKDWRQTSMPNRRRTRPACSVRLRPPPLPLVAPASERSSPWSCYCDTRTWCGGPACSTLVPWTAPFRIARSGWFYPSLRERPWREGIPWQLLRL